VENTLKISNFHLTKFVGAPAPNHQNHSTKFDEWFC